MILVNNKGFTVIEMLVALAIFVTFTGITLFNYPRFSNKVSLDLLAHNVALTVRQAQTYGLAVKAFPGVIPFPAYGVHFELAGIETNPIKSFILFADECPTATPDKLYKLSGCPSPPPGTDPEFFEKFTIPPGTNSITALCANEPLVDPKNPAASTGCSSLASTFIDITFKSPRPDARIYLNGNTATAASDAEIIFSNSRGDAKAIVISKTGQISIR